MKKTIIICGGGAACFFAAITIAEKHPHYQVTILEKSNKMLSKVPAQSLRTVISLMMSLL